MRRALLAAVACVSLAACATAPTHFQPAASPGGIGYSEMRIEPGRYRVTFQGGAGAPEAQVMDYALLRAADLALAPPLSAEPLSPEDWSARREWGN